MGKLKSFLKKRRRGSSTSVPDLRIRQRSFSIAKSFSLFSRYNRKLLKRKRSFDSVASLHSQDIMYSDPEFFELETIHGGSANSRLDLRYSSTNFLFKIIIYSLGGILLYLVRFGEFDYFNFRLSIRSAEFGNHLPDTVKVKIVLFLFICTVIEVAAVVAVLIN